MQARKRAGGQHCCDWETGSGQTKEKIILSMKIIFFKSPATGLATNFYGFLKE